MKPNCFGHADEYCKDGKCLSVRQCSFRTQINKRKKNIPVLIKEKTNG